MLHLKQEEKLQNKIRNMHHYDLKSCVDSVLGMYMDFKRIKPFHFLLQII